MKDQKDLDQNLDKTRLRHLIGCIEGVPLLDEVYYPNIRDIYNVYVVLTERLNLGIKTTEIARDRISLELTYYSTPIDIILEADDELHKKNDKISQMQKSIRHMKNLLSRVNTHRQSLEGKLKLYEDNETCKSHIVYRTNDCKITVYPSESISCINNQLKDGKEIKYTPEKFPRIANSLAYNGSYPADNKAIYVKQSKLTYVKTSKGNYISHYKHIPGEMEDE